MDKKERRFIRIDRFCLDASERILLHGPAETAADPKVFERCCCWLKTAGAFLGKEELLQASGPTALLRKAASHKISPCSEKPSERRGWAAVY